MKGVIDDTMSVLDKSLLRMASLTEDLIDKVEVFTFEEGEKHIEDLKQESSEIEIESRDMEALCLRIILRRHPVARDLRRVTAVNRIVSDLDRIGNNAYDLAEVCSFVEENGILEDVGIRRMIAVVKKMLSMSIDSYLSSDIQKSFDVINSDDELDNLFIRAKDNLAKAIKNGENGAEFAPDALLAAKYLERMGDHAVNIARQIIWAQTGD